ncbi:Bor family protein [Aeromonas sobria]|uniref:Bor family protein n=1 Tax=Aeromonas sobria TaxID=646 RepID=UPI001116F616|nr:Bor family protein [Aeromonas sobria]TNH83615.1 lipoprotein bor [Aeromonas sobria]
MKQVVWMACCALLLSGCAQQTFFVHEGNPGQPTREVRHDFVLAGIGQSEMVDASLACHSDPKKVVRVEMQQSPQDVLMAILTLGIYTPRTARVYCNL